MEVFHIEMSIRSRYMCHIIKDISNYGNNMYSEYDFDRVQE